MEERTELILRLKGLTAAQADRLAEVLTPVAQRPGGSLSRIDREEHGNYALHKRRRKIV